MKRRREGYDILWSEASKLTLRQVAGVLAIVEDGLAQHFATHLLNSIGGKQLEGLRHSNRGDAFVSQTKFRHGMNLWK